MTNINLFLTKPLSIRKTSPYSNLENGLNQSCLTDQVFVFVDVHLLVSKSRIHQSSNKVVFSSRENVSMEIYQ
jgi:hypothetical protein